MDIDLEQQDGVTVVRPAGFVDAGTAPTLGGALDGQLQAGHCSLVVDLDKLEYMSSAGLRVLLAAVKEARRRGGDLRLANPRTEVRQVLQMSGFLAVLPVFATLPEAVASYQTSA